VRHVMAVGTVVAALACGAAEASAQYDGGSTSRGVAVGGELLTTVMRAEYASGRKETPAGVGLRAVVSYGLTQHWAVFAAASTSSIRTGGAEGLRQGEFGARYTFLDEEAPARPYIEAGFSRRQFRTNLPRADGTPRTINSIGNGPIIAGGVQLFVNRRFAADLGVAVSTGSFRDPRIARERVPVLTGSTPGTSLRIGVKYFFRGDREIE
jgi:hypothetical protein